MFERKIRKAPSCTTRLGHCTSRQSNGLEARVGLFEAFLLKDPGAGVSERSTWVSTRTSPLCRRNSSSGSGSKKPSVSSSPGVVRSSLQPLRQIQARPASSYEHLSLTFISTLRGSGTPQGNTLSEKLIGHIIPPGDAMIYWLVKRIIIEPDSYHSNSDRQRRRYA